jgi:anti-anti-sigma factor
MLRDSGVGPMFPTFLQIRGPLQAPVDDELRDKVRTSLRQGCRDIVLDLACVPSIDAVGIGELISVYNLVHAVNGELRIVNVTARVRETLELVGVFATLSDSALDRTDASQTVTAT